MKVLVIPGWYPSKYTPQNGNFYVERIKNLRQSGVDIAVISADLDYRYYLHGNGFFLKKSFSIDNEVPTFRIAGGAWPKWNKHLLDRWANAFLGLFVDYEKKYGQPDLLHAHNFWGGYVAMKLSQKWKIPYIFSESFSGTLGGDLSKWKIKAYREICTYASYVTAVSHALANVMEQNYTSKKCLVIPNYINTEMFGLKSRPLEKPIRFLGIGNLIPLKRFDIQIRALSMLAKKGYNAELTIVGMGSRKAFLVRLVKSLGLSENVHFVRSLPYHEIPDQFHKANIFLSTSDTETFGNAIIEALSTGIPVIATACAGPIDIINEDVGVLIPNNDSRALSEAMEKMIVNYEAYKPNQIRQYVKSKYSKEVVVSQIKRLYDRTAAYSAPEKG